MLKSQGLLSRISAFDSFRRVSSQLIKPESSQESTNNNNIVVSPLNSSAPVFENATFGSQSQTVSPVSLKSSYSISSAIASIAFPDESKKKEENVVKEICILREQVEYLTQKAQIVESDLKKTSIQLKEASKELKDERERNKAANEEIRSLTSQVSELLQSLFWKRSFWRLLLKLELKKKLCFGIRA